MVCPPGCGEEFTSRFLAAFHLRLFGNRLWEAKVKFSRRKADAPCPKLSAAPTACHFNEEKCRLCWKGSTLSTAYAWLLKQLSMALLADMFSRHNSKNVGIPCRCGVLLQFLYRIAKHSLLCKGSPLTWYEFFLGMVGSMFVTRVTPGGEIEKVLPTLYRHKDLLELARAGSILACSAKTLSKQECCQVSVISWDLDS